VHARETLANFPRRSPEILSQLVPGELSAYNEVDLREGSVRVVAGHPLDMRVGSEMQAAFQPHVHEHPVIHRVRKGDPRPLKISDFLTARQFRRLGLYNEVFRPRGLEDQIAVSLPRMPNRVVGIVINRSRPTFSERDRSLLTLLRPHLVEAYRTAAVVAELEREVAFLRRALEEACRAAVLCSAEGRIEQITPRARDRLARSFGARTATFLPEDLRTWVSRWCREVDVSLYPSIVLQREGAPLGVRLARYDDEGRFLVLFEEPHAVPQAASLAPLGLTAREAEVLSWIARGKTNGEIGTILSIRPRTVEKHVERILMKLGVETRTAAAAIALETVQRRTG
jgi:DNA-binding CsgD family transcriptional regulator